MDAVDVRGFVRGAWHRRVGRGAARRVARLLAVGAVVAVATACPPPRPPTTPLPVPPPGPCDPATATCPTDLTEILAAAGIDRPLSLAISGDGEIVGSTSPFSPSTAQVTGNVGFRLSSAGRTSVVHPRTAGGQVSLDAVNTAGLAVGYESAWGIRPMVWDEANRPIDLGPKLPRYGGIYRDGAASDVNEHGVVAGSYLVEVGPPGARQLVWLIFVWDSRTDALTVVNPEAVHLPGAGIQASYLVGIDDRGVVAASQLPSGATGDQIVRWAPQADGTYRPEALGPGEFVAVSPAGDVLGYRDQEAPGSPRRAVVWPAASTVPTVLPPPPGWAPGSDLSYSVADINARGEIVGTYTNGGNARRPIRWPSRTEPPELLETDGRARVSAERISDTGDILGIWVPGEPGGLLDDLLAERRLLRWDR